MENEVIWSPKKDYYISYNANTFDEGKQETAVCVPDGRKAFGTAFYILYGDWRKEYEEAMKEGLPAVFEVFKGNQDKIGYTSDILVEA